MPAAPLTLHLAAPVDRADLDRLAGLDSAAPLVSPALLARRDGRPVAALSLADGRAVADPFLPAADALALLRLRARQLAAPARPRRGLRRRLAAHRSAGLNSSM